MTGSSRPVDLLQDMDLVLVASSADEVVQRFFQSTPDKLASATSRACVPSRPIPWD